MDPNILGVIGSRFLNQVPTLSGESVGRFMFLVRNFGFFVSGCRFLAFGGFKAWVYGQGAGNVSNRLQEKTGLPTTNA